MLRSYGHLPFGRKTSTTMRNTLNTTTQAMTRDERRRELEQIRSEVGGSRRIAEIFGGDPRPGDWEITPASFVQAMIDQILRREFPDGDS